MYTCSLTSFFQALLPWLQGMSQVLYLLLKSIRFKYTEFGIVVLCCHFVKLFRSELCQFIWFKWNSLVAMETWAKKYFHDASHQIENSIVCQN